ncbi:HDOD domain-containing protein [Ramlibacter sp. H39-3-26]|uniref:HDOD domain-containing protein n=1 Tax=Curvibacter soli TaxID=3031331 RepID=UPI0023D9ED4A|nr:HDOD domain-containing protein [Ramlibacter sp. H39-3-26]MDF1485811.1 HDOD domain-containing protein [Ramlibacter sp. H39-3-26]
MVQSVLGSLTLGYRPIWNRARTLAGVELFVQGDTAAMEAPLLLRTLQELWDHDSPPLLLSLQSPDLLANWLDSAPADSPWIAVRDDWLIDPALVGKLRRARARGLHLVWHGDLAHLPEPELAGCFEKSLLSMQPEETMAALQAAGAAKPSAQGAPQRPSPVIEGQIYEDLASRALVEHCLDQKNAWGVIGWPADDVLYAYRHQPPQPAHSAIVRLMKAIEAEQPVETFETLLGADPLLAYRFLLFTNSAALGLRAGVDSLRRGLMMVGYGTLRHWLGDQLPQASEDANLRPISVGMVLRGRLTEHLLEAGVEQDLRREVYLCGLFSQLGDLLCEPVGASLKRLPLSERIYDAIVLHAGPYAPSLEMACALESANAPAIRKLCETHALGADEVNRALLRMLAGLSVTDL